MGVVIHGGDLPPKRVVSVHHTRLVQRSSSRRRIVGRTDKIPDVPLQWDLRNNSIKFFAVGDDKSQVAGFGYANCIADTVVVVVATTDSLGTDLGVQ